MAPGYAIGDLEATINQRFHEAFDAIHQLKLYATQVKFGIRQTAAIGIAIDKIWNEPDREPQSNYEQISKKWALELRARNEEPDKHWKKFADEMKNNERKFNDMALLNAVAIFDAFTVDVFSAALLARPEMMRRNQKTMSFDEIVALGSMDAVVQRMADKTMSEIAYLPVAQQWQKYKEFGVDVKDASIDMDEVADMMGQRNLLAHNHGRVNERYLSSLKKPSLKLGDKVEITNGQWERYTKLINDLMKFTADKLKEAHCKPQQS